MFITDDNPGDDKEQQPPAKRPDDKEPRPPPKSPKGLSPVDSLSMSRDLLLVVNWLSRRKQARLEEIQQGVGKSRERIEAALTSLKESEYVGERVIDGQIYYRVIYGGKVKRPTRKLSGDIWSRIDPD